MLFPASVRVNIALDIYIAGLGVNLLLIAVYLYVGVKRGTMPRLSLSAWALGLTAVTVLSVFSWILTIPVVWKQLRD